MTAVSFALDPIPLVKAQTAAAMALAGKNVEVTIAIQAPPHLRPIHGYSFLKPP